MSHRVPSNSVSPVSPSSCPPVSRCVPLCPRGHLHNSRYFDQEPSPTTIVCLDQTRQIPHQCADTTIQEHVRSTHVHSATNVVFARDHIQPLNAQLQMPNSEVLSPVNVQLFFDLLSVHPNQNLVRYVTEGLIHGFSIGFSGQLTKSASRNLKSAYTHANALSDAIDKEITRIQQPSL